MKKKMHLPSDTTLWRRLKNHYQDDIIIIQKRGVPAYCCLKKKGYDIFRSQKESTAEESLHYQLIDKVLFDEVKEHFTTDFKEYPESDKMFDKARKLPETLKYLLDKLILNQYRKEKNPEFYEPQTISIAHAIMSVMFALDTFSTPCCCRCCSTS